MSPSGQRARLVHLPALAANNAGRSGGKTGGASHNGDSLEYVYSEGEQV